jgi:7-cyano-7-deazaguanine synthase in queuosine biosynthesis
VINPTFRYRVDDLGAVHSLGGDGSSTRTAHVFVDGVQRPQGWLGNFAEPERDLLRVASALLDLDRLSLRRPLNTKETKRELHWRRNLHATIVVENPERWNALANELHHLLSFLTDDGWNLEFEQGQPFHEQQELFRPEFKEGAEIALFSGGLDSSVGMRARHLKAGSSFVAVSAAGNEVRRRAQAAALKSLTGLGVEVNAISVVHQLRSEMKRSRRSLEPTQRTRGLFFLAMGAAVASRLKTSRVHVYETGIGCLNIPTSSAQVASQGTRATHPLTISRFNHLIKLMLDRHPQVVAPFFFLTKGELCQLVGDDLQVLAATSSSCDEGDGHKRDPMQHCGLCTSCMFRRISIASSGAIDPTSYRDTPSRRHNSYEVLSFEHHAASLSSAETFEDLTDHDPNVRFALAPPTGAEMDVGEVRREVVAMYRRYGKEIQSYLNASRPKLQPRPQRVAKEVERDLFAATR